MFFSTTSFSLNLQYYSQSTWKMFSYFLTANYDLSLFSILLYQWNKIIAPHHKASNLWPLHWGHFDTITSITWPPCLSEAIWHDKWAVWWLRWAVCVCVAVCTDWPVLGEGGPVSGRRRRCTTVHQPLCHLGQPHTHTHTNFRRNPALMFILQKLFCDKYTASNTVLLCTCVAFICLPSLHLDLCTAPRGVLCISIVCFRSRYMFILLWSAHTHLWSGLIVTTHSFKCFQFCCRLKQQPLKIVSLCFSCAGYLAALQLDSMLCISQSETVSALHSK